MRVFKKIMYIILALVPILPLLIFAVCNVGNANGVDVMPFGVFSVYQSSDESTNEISTIITVEKDTLMFYFTEGLIPVSGGVRTDEYFTDVDNDGVVDRTWYRIYVSNDHKGFIHRAVGFYQWFVSVGITPPLYVVFVFGYLSYMFFIHFCFMIFDLVVFVPRKISELLEV